MARMKLTSRVVANYKTERAQEDVWDELLPGLGLRVSRTGSKTWVVRYRSEGRHRRLKLGTYPHLSLADARERARRILADAQAGEDPAESRKIKRSGEASFGALVEEVLAVKARETREATQRERRRIADAELLPAWRNRPAGSITRRDVVELVEAIAARGAPVMANRTLALVKVIFNTGLRRGFPGLEANPAHMADPPAVEEGRDRFLSRDELRVIWNSLEDESPVVRAVFRFAILTAQRIGSVCALRWRDIDGAGVWHIPPAAFKGKRPHLVPLSTEALAVLEELRPLTGAGEHAFPGRGTGRHPYFAGKNKAVQRLREKVEIPHWTIHDFRTTFRTHATRAANPDHPSDPAGLGVAPHIADAVLGHKEASLGFDRYTGEPERYLLAEKREALAKWGAFVRAAVEEGGGS